MTENTVECTAGPLELRVMGDPCPRCSGTDYYCAEEGDRHIEHLQAEVERVIRDNLTLGHKLITTTDERDGARAEVERMLAEKDILNQRLESALKEVGWLRDRLASVAGWNDES